MEIHEQNLRNRLAKYKSLNDLLLADHLDKIAGYRASLILGSIAILLCLYVGLTSNTFSSELWVGLAVLTLYLIWRLRSAPKGVFLSHKVIQPSCIELRNNLFKNGYSDDMIANVENEVITGQFIYFDANTIITPHWIIKPFSLDKKEAIIKRNLLRVEKCAAPSNYYNLKFYDVDEKTLDTELDSNRGMVEKKIELLRKIFPDVMIDPQWKNDTYSA